MPSATPPHPDDDLANAFALLRAGHRDARDRLYHLVYQHMRRIAGRILSQSFSRLRNHHDVTSIVHDAWINLDRALATVNLETEADFTRFIAHKIRQVLLTFASRTRPEVPRAQPATDVSSIPSTGDPPDHSSDPQALAQWTEFHAQVNLLPESQRDVFSLHYYLDMPQARIAELLSLTPKQVSRLWIAATEALADNFFDGSPRRPSGPASRPAGSPEA